jgi:hypothetical protein
MPELIGDLSPYGYMLDLFGSQSARSGGIVRRKMRDIDRYVGRDAFLSEMRRRGYSVVENAGQYVVFCNVEPIRRVV